MCKASLPQRLQKTCCSIVLQQDRRVGRAERFCDRVKHEETERNINGFNHAVYDLYSNRFTYEEPVASRAVQSMGDAEKAAFLAMSAADRALFLAKSHTVDTYQDYYSNRFTYEEPATSRGVQSKILRRGPLPVMEPWSLSTSIWAPRQRWSDSKGVC